MRPEVRRIQEQMECEAYVADRSIATAIHLGMELGRPLLVEGPAGVGKTEIAKVLARILETELIRLQCYEGLDAATALYEWNYPKQMLRIKLEESADRPTAEKEASIFTEAYLLERPLLRAIRSDSRAPVLLIDEVDRADEEFEAFLLEILSDFQITIPELGTLRAKHRPHVVLTSNRSRELSDALRRRCLFLWIDYPSFDKELRIVRARVPGIGERLAERVTTVLHALRDLELTKVPGISETLDWARALVALGAADVDESLVHETLGCIVKDEFDRKRVLEQLSANGLEALIQAQPVA